MDILLNEEYFFIYFNLILFVFLCVINSDKWNVEYKFIVN